ncbi:hypothetical protein BC938DRAFT_476721 [Jimgerdemannia flammicorona]|uniref:Myb-like domain-containing protein n=1 Tax=Jimgerdemannia flammicorona TaxID=994334 RepID=A0A433PEU9_9FUNG|nr:hypothetical protein BC938DRAFT_476721 [Jimgerdemannia flammicorona]
MVKRVRTNDEQAAVRPKKRPAPTAAKDPTEVKTEDGAPGREPSPRSDEDAVMPGPKKAKVTWTKAEERALIAKILEGVKPAWSDISREQFSGKFSGNSCLKKWQAIRKRLLEE